MKLVRFIKGAGDKPQYGLLSSEGVTALSCSPCEGSFETVGPSCPLNEVKLLAPAVPTKIVAVGLNYRDHAAELGMKLPDEPLLFLKPPSSITGPGGAIKLPEMSRQVEYEAELAVVIKQRCKNVPLARAKEVILGYTCLNDVTARDLQQKDVQFTRSKSFDTFCPIGPWIETDLDPTDLKIRSILNGEIRQDSSTNQLIYDPFELVSFISRVMTLEAGDIIATGTPVGVGRLSHGDEIAVSIENIGELRNYVEQEG